MKLHDGYSIGEYEFSRHGKRHQAQSALNRETHHGMARLGGDGNHQRVCGGRPFVLITNKTQKSKGKVGCEVAQNFVVGSEAVISCKRTPQTLCYADRTVDGQNMHTIRKGDQVIDRNSFGDVKSVATRLFHSFRLGGIMVGKRICWLAEP